MAIKLIAQTKHFQGLSSDEKPNPAADGPPIEGSTYHEVDTGYTFVFHDGTWQPDLRLIAALRSA